MSTPENEQLLEEAANYIDLYEGTTVGKMLELAVEQNDLEQVYVLLREIRRKEFEDNFSPYAEYSDVG